MGIVGAFCLIGAWVAGEGGRFFGLSQMHLFSDAAVFELMTIAMAVCTLVRLQLENEISGARRII